MKKKTFFILSGIRIVCGDGLGEGSLQTVLYLTATDRREEVSKAPPFTLS